MTLLIDFKSEISTTRANADIGRNIPKNSRFLVSTAICAIVATGVLTAQTGNSAAQETCYISINKRTGAKSIADQNGCTAEVENKENITLNEMESYQTVAARAINVSTVGAMAEKGENNPGGGITITNSGDLRTANGKDNLITSTSAAIWAKSTGGRGIWARPERKLQAGDGSDGGDITVNNFGAITSDAEQTYGIQIMSYGGQGGGADREKRGYPAGIGGKGGDVTLNNSNNITTKQSDSAAIVLQSNGGALGQGGTKNGQKSGGKVTVYLKPLNGGGPSLISTSGLRSPGIVAQSVGGGDTQYDISNGTPQAVSGGNGGEVEIHLGENRIETTADLSHGIVGQSIGGSSGLSSKGNAGSHGGNAAKVSLRAGSDSMITTAGLNSDGILLQSIGGSGGAGGFDSGSVAVGGRGGDGGNGGAIDVEMHGTIITKAEDSLDISKAEQSLDILKISHSVGILAQSIGGGGGRGGNANAKSTFSALAIGGDGGNGGDGGAISITVNKIVTEGLFSHAINAMSIGGGGGHGGIATAEATGIVAFATAIGGKGGIGGHGGEVNLTLEGAITTYNGHSFGAIASSIGGGGGHGGSAHSFSGSFGEMNLSVSVGMGGNGNTAGDGGNTTIEQTKDSTITTYAAFSTGMAALSVGGGGGTGGNAQTFAVGASAGEGAVGGSIAVSIGGAGGKGGNGNNVTMTSRGTVTTNGDFALGMHGLSAGGGGGSGGNSIALTAEASTGMAGAMSVGVGGKGGPGGSGGTVTITLDKSTIATSGSHAAAIVAQSIGGGGGAGGSALSAAASAGVEGGASAISVGIGGSGGVGGSGGNIEITSNPSKPDNNADPKNTLTTQGSMSPAILAQSIGGGGGHGGHSISAAVSMSAETSLSMSTSVGGNGGGAGGGGTVNVELKKNQPAITTTGHHSSAIVAQSIGGGGGHGGSAFSLSASASSESKSDSISAGVGGSGGKGGYGGKVTLDSHSDITTNGSMSHAILAQSIGGGGGSGGNSISAAVSLAAKRARSMTASIGGSGSSGGPGNNVTVNASGKINVNGQLSMGIAGHSIGGGGGIGGNSESASVAIVPDKNSPNGTNSHKSKTVTVSVGGNGGDGGKGKGVTITSDATVTTKGNIGIGLLAQSVGGGGGVGGHADSVFTTSLSEKPDRDTDDGFSVEHLKNHELALGGYKGSGGNGSFIKITQSSKAVKTYGDSAVAILGQSIGGGGGLVGAADHLSFLKVGRIGGKDTISGGFGGEVTIEAKSVLYTEGLFASGIVAQSIGGGGGATLMSENLRERFLKTNDLHTQTGNMRVGGVLTSGMGGVVSVVNSGHIVTKGNYAAGIIAQSIGGGGGLATIDNANSKTNVSVASALEKDTTKDNGASDVYITQSGLINTSGKGAIGLIAQSIGGGGGLIQAASEIIDKSVSDNNNAHQNKHIGGGNGGAVRIFQPETGAIETTGTGAVGIFAQSIGGTGGFIQESDGNIALHLLNSSGAGGDVIITQNGSLRTHGESATGIYAVAHGTSTPGNINVAINGKVETTGDKSTAVFLLASNIHNETGTIDVTVGKDGEVISTGYKSSAIQIYDITNGAFERAVIYNSGLISSKKGLAIGSNQNLTIHNGGVIKGDIDLTDTRNIYHGGRETLLYTKGTILNFQPGTIESANRIDLGGFESENPRKYQEGSRFSSEHLGYFLNGGKLSPGGSGVIMHTALNGRYAQLDTATYVVDLDLNTGNADKFTADQGLNIKGTVAPRILSFGPKREMTIFSTPNSEYFELAAKTANTPVVTYALTKQNGSNHHQLVNVAIKKIDFNAKGLNSNEIAIAKTLNARLAGGAKSNDPHLLALANAATLQEYSGLLGSFSSTHHAKKQVSVRSGSTNFTNAIYSCGVANGANAAIAEGECDWSEAGYRWTEHSAKGNTPASQDRTFNLSAGVQRAVGQYWRLGLAAGYGNLTSTSTFTHAEMDAVHLGMVAKYQKDSLLLGGSIGVGYGRQEMQRSIALQPGTTASSKADHLWIHGRLRAAYLFESDSGFLKPRADFDINYLNSGAYTETGAGIYNLSVFANQDFQVSMAAGLEFGFSFKINEDLSVRAYGYAGVRYLPDNSSTLQVQLSGAATPMTHVSFQDSYLTEVSAGLKFFGQDRLGLDVRYDGAFGKTVQSHAINAKLRFSF